MKTIYLILTFIFINLSLFAQNVGINQTSPTNSLHISPVTIGNDPLRIDGVQSYSVGDTSLLMINTTTGIVKYINPSDFVSIINGGIGSSTDDQNIDSLTLNGLTLTTFIENGSSANIDLTPISDSTISYLINNSDTLFSNQTFADSITALIYNNADTLLSNTSFINNLRDSIDTDVDSATLVGTTLTIYENGNGVFVDLSSLSDADADPTNEIQDLNLTGNNLTITNNSTPTSIDLSSYLDNTDAQTLSLSGSTLSISNGNNVTLTDNVNDADSDATNELQTISESGNTVTLSNGGGSFTDTDTQLTEAQVDAFANNNGYLTSFTEVDGSVTNEIQNLSLSGTTLSISSANNVNLSTFNDHDWYEVGGTNQPNNITDNIYTQGYVGIGINTPSTRTEIHHNISREYTLKLFHNQNVSGNGLLIESNGGDTDDTLFYVRGDLNGTAKENFIILGDGKTGIRTNSPDVTLDVNGKIRGQLDTYRIGGAITSQGQCFSCLVGDYLISAYESCLDNCTGNPCDADLTIDLTNNRFCAGSNDQTGWCAFGVCLRGSR